MTLASGGCTGTSPVMVTVSAAPTVGNQTATTCSGTAFSVTPGPVGTTYTWTAPTGTGFTGGAAQTTAQTAITGTLTNPGTTPVIANYTVTPFSGSCAGTPFTLAVTVSPALVIPNQTATVCSGTGFTVTPAGTPAGTTYTWTAPTGTGFTGGAAQPTGQTNISGTLTNNTGAAPVNAVYNVTPSQGTCPGTPFTVTVTVNPAPVITAQTANHM